MSSHWFGKPYSEDISLFKKKKIHDHYIASISALVRTQRRQAAKRSLTLKNCRQFYYTSTLLVTFSWPQLTHHPVQHAPHTWLHSEAARQQTFSLDTLTSSRLLAIRKKIKDYRTLFKGKTDEHRLVTIMKALLAHTVELLAACNWRAIQISAFLCETRHVRALLQSCFFAKFCFARLLSTV